MPPTAGCRELLATLLLASLGAQAVAAEPARHLTLFEAMKGTVVPKTQVIWDITNAAQDDMGNVTAGALKPADWSRISAAAGDSSRAIRNLLTQPRVMSAPAGAKIENEGQPDALGAREVQQAIDANPAAFAAYAQQLIAAFDGISGAARNRDAAKVGSIAGELDEICEACHRVFWYPTKAPGK